jgi:hypothetical protein
MLFLGKRDTDDLDVVQRRQIERKLAPAATDVEHALTRREVELGRQEPQLVALRLLQGIVVAQEISAGILHSLIQEQSIELVPQIVVMGHVSPRLADWVGLLEPFERP